MIALITFFTCSWGCSEGTRKLGVGGKIGSDADDDDATSNGRKIVIELADLGHE